MTIKLSAAQEEYIREKMATGKYASEEEVVAEAFRVLRNVEKMMPEAQDDLRRELQQGLDDVDAGRVSDWNVEEMKARLLEQMKAKKAS
jgi:antitoxin ParD1/3/4